ncbi:hypothetical protein [Paenibacillus sp. GM2FR]|nr:hypothetical protein [Paenibacillus sp. GM2FR]
MKLFGQPATLFGKRNTLDLGQVLLQHRILLTDRFALTMIEHE